MLGLVACDGGGGFSQYPSPKPTPIPTPTTVTLQGQVSENAPFSDTKIPGAKVEFIDGTNAGKNAITDANGNYGISDLARGGFTVRASAAGFQEASTGITITTNTVTVTNFSLAPTGPRTQFGPGQYRVNSEIAAGAKTVSIRTSDAGFSTIQCGTWTRTANLLSENAVSLDPASEIEYNWLRSRQRDPRLTTRP